MSATARLVVQMTPVEKDALDRRARRSGLSISEYVRRRIGEDEVVENQEEIEALLSAIEASTPAILKSLDEAIGQVSTLTASIGALNQPSV